MANTLELGNGKWATGKDTVLAFNDENNNFKPLPFSFSRASSGTVVNKDGLIETVGSGEPRIDFKDNTKGALLLEPSRSNIVIYSEAFDNSYWNKSSSSVLGGFASPSSDSPLSAFKIVEDTSTTLHEMWAGVTGAVAGSDFAYSVFAKKGERDKFYVGDGSAGSTESYFDLTNGTVLYSGANTNGSFIEDYGNGWYKCTSVYDRNNTTRPMTIGLLENSYTTGTRTHYTGDGTSGIYIYGAECEQGSYATSYIPTSGGAVTRVEDVCNNGGNNQVINSTEGVLYAEISALVDGGDTRGISLFDAANNRITLTLHSTTNRVQFFIAINGYVNTVDLDATDIIQTDINKIACKFKANDYALWINGIEKDTDTTQSSTIQGGALNSLDLDINGNADFYGKIKDLRIYNTALTDAELQALTQ